MLTQPEFPGWGFWIKNFNTSTLFESWRGHQSHNHIMFGDVSAWFYQYAAGIRPPEEVWGFKKIRIEPCFISGIEWVKAQHMTPFGIIEVQWKRENDTISLVCKFPVGIETEIVLNNQKFQSDTGTFSKIFINHL